MKKIVGWTAAIFLVLSAMVHADTIYLKDGKKVTGQIVEDRGHSVRIIVAQVPYVYYKSEIERVVKGEEPQEQKLMPEKQEIKEIKEIPSEKKELILRLLDANGARDNMNRNFVQIVEEAPEAERSQIRELLKTDEIIQQLVPVYEKYYSVEELKELITFYKSPTGAKHVANTPKIMEETIKVTAKYFQDKAAKSGSKTK
jgi:uncharacterized protein